MGFLGLGLIFIMLQMKYGLFDFVDFIEQVVKEMVVIGWKIGLELVQEKGLASIMEQDFVVDGVMLCKCFEMKKDGFKVGDKVKGKILYIKYSCYM